MSFHRNRALCREVHSLGRADCLQLAACLGLMSDAVHQPRSRVCKLRERFMEGREPVAEVDAGRFRSLSNSEVFRVNFVEAEFFGGSLPEALRGAGGRFVHDTGSRAGLRVSVHQAFHVAQGIFVKAPGILPGDGAIFDPHQ